MARAFPSGGAALSSAQSPRDRPRGRYVDQAGRGRAGLRRERCGCGGGLAANATISALLVLALLSGGFRSGEWRAVAVLALIVFWTNMGREIVMDIVDLEADRSQGYRTVPLIHGVRAARSLAGVCLILG